MPDMTPRRKMLLSRDLRRRSTYTENLAWNLLRNRRHLNLKFRRQYGIAGFIVDFYCPELSLAIEIDGSSHIGREGYDAWRQEQIERKFITFIRITNEVLESNPEILLDRISEVAEVRRRKSLTPNPSPAGRFNMSNAPERGIPRRSTPKQHEC